MSRCNKKAHCLNQRDMETRIIKCITSTEERTNLRVDTSEQRMKQIEVNLDEVKRSIINNESDLRNNGVKLSFFQSWALTMVFIKVVFSSS